MLKRRIAESVARWIVGIGAGAGVAVSGDLAMDIAAGLVALAMLVWSVLDKVRNG
jgi:hypothetical protein